MHAIESGDEDSRRLAMGTILKRQGHLNILQIIQRVDTLNDETCVEFSQSPERFTPALKQCFSHSDQATQLAAIEFVRRTANFDEFDTLLELLEADDESLGAAAVQAASNLAERMMVRFRTRDVSALPCFEEQTLSDFRMTIVERLDFLILHVASRRNPLPLYRLLLTLGRADDKAILNVLYRRGSEHRETATRLLSEESNAAFFQLICESLNRHSPPTAIIDAFHARQDLEFVVHFLSWLPVNPAAYLKSNLARLTEISWLRQSHPTFQQIPATLHDRLVAVINLAGIEKASRTELKTWVVRQSGATGRAAASDVLNTLPKAAVEKILHGALESDDPDVEAWATRLLRSQKLANTFPELLKRLDGNLEIIRDAARDELFSFDVKRLLELFPQLSPAQCRQCGTTLLKINPDATNELNQEMSHAFRQRRMRAIQATESLGLVEQLYGSIVNALSDPEASVRRTAIETIGRNPSSKALDAIMNAVEDDHRSVRDSARRTLSHLRQQLSVASGHVAEHAQRKHHRTDQRSMGSESE
ncbi:MAG: HEAT repeat domain-containing protein [Planctomycetota bacterium]|nr:HEAT repeat domain-containing protein [Planctomycetota bacterium]